jgi:hypothetical protein
MSDVDDFIAHYGVQGMRWGVRRGSKGPQSVTLTAKPGKKIRTAGGKGFEASPEAKSAAAFKQIAKKSGPQALSNDQMKQLVTRMNLEQQYSKMLAANKPQKNAGRAFIEKEAAKLAKKKGPDLFDWLIGDYRTPAQKAADKKK